MLITVCDDCPLNISSLQDTEILRCLLGYEVLLGKPIGKYFYYSPNCGLEYVKLRDQIIYPPKKVAYDF